MSLRRKEEEIYIYVCMKDDGIKHILDKRIKIKKIGGERGRVTANEIQNPKASQGREERDSICISNPPPLFPSRFVTKQKLDDAGISFQ